MISLFTDNMTQRKPIVRDFALEFLDLNNTNFDYDAARKAYGPAPSKRKEKPEEPSAETNNENAKTWKQWPNQLKKKKNHQHNTTSSGKEALRSSGNYNLLNLGHINHLNRLIQGLQVDASKVKVLRNHEEWNEIGDNFMDSVHQYGLICMDFFTMSGAYLIVGNMVGQCYVLDSVAFAENHNKTMDEMNGSRQRHLPSVAVWLPVQLMNMLNSRKVIKVGHRIKRGFYKVMAPQGIEEMKQVLDTDEVVCKTMVSKEILMAKTNGRASGLDQQWQTANPGFNMPRHTSCQERMLTFERRAKEGYRKWEESDDAEATRTIIHFNATTPLSFIAKLAANALYQDSTSQFKSAQYAINEVVREHVTDLKSSELKRQQASKTNNAKSFTRYTSEAPWPDNDLVMNISQERSMKDTINNEEALILYSNINATIKVEKIDWANRTWSEESKGTLQVTDSKANMIQACKKHRRWSRHNRPYVLICHNEKESYADDQITCDDWKFPHKIRFTCSKQCFAHANDNWYLTYTSETGTIKRRIEVREGLVKTQNIDYWSDSPIPLCPNCELLELH